MAYEPSQVPPETTRLAITLESEGDTADPSAVGRVILAMAALMAEIRDAWGENEQLLVRVRPFSSGSFTIPIELAAAAALLLPEGSLIAQVLAVLKELLGIAKLAAGQRIVVKAANIVVVAGNTITVNPTTSRLLRPGGAYSEFREAARSVSEDETVKRLVIRQQGSGEPLASISREELSGIHSSQVVRELPGSRERTEEAVLAVLCPAFHRKYQWRFLFNGAVIWAEIRDGDFLGRVASGEAFAEGDSLRALLLTEEEYDPERNGYRPTRHTVLRVVEHVRRAEQEPSLFGG